MPRNEVLEYFAPNQLPIMDKDWFPPDFLTGCDVSFVIADKTPENKPFGYLEAQVVDFQFGVVQNKRPVFGYADYTWHRIAKGNILVQGQFSIPFTRKFRLFEALQRAQAEELPGEERTPDTFKRQLDDWNAMSLQDKLDVVKNGDIDRSLLGLILDTDNDNPGVVEEETIHPKNRLGSSPQGLEIVIYYGNAATESQKQLDSMKGYRGPVSNDPKKRALTIHQVHLSQNTQVIRPKGTPVLEQYSFIARDYE